MSLYLNGNGTDLKEETLHSHTLAVGESMRFISPKVGYAFKKIFGSEQIKDILISFHKLREAIALILRQLKTQKALWRDSHGDNQSI